MNPLRNNLTWQSKRIYTGIKQLPKLRLSVLRKVFSLMGQRERNSLLILLVIALITFVFSSTNLLSNYTIVKPAHGGSYSEGMIGQPRFINPLLATSPTDKAIINLVYAGLYKFDGNGSVIPQLATDFPVLSEDEKTYTITLKNNITWHNGIPFTADDIVFTITTLQNPAFNSPLRNDWLSTTVEVIDDLTIKFTLENASGIFLNNLTLPIISKAVWSQTDPDDFILSQSNIEAIGSGPYRIKEVKKLTQGAIQSLTLESYSDFVTDPAYIDTVKLYFYENGEDLLKAVHGKKINGFGFSQFETRVSLKDSAKDLVVHQIPLPQYQAAFINTANRDLGDSRVRSALNLATDAQAILTQVYDDQGILIDSPILRQHVDQLPKTTSTYNIQEAKTILEQAGWLANADSGVLKKGSRELNFNLATNDTPINVRTAELLKQQWQQVGVNLTLNILPTRELSENIIKPRKYDILLFAQKLSADPDPFVFWHSSQSKNPGLNLSNYDNQAIDSFITDARSATDKATRDGYYLQMHEIFKQDIPAIFLVQTVFTYAITKDIQGFDINSLPDETARFYNLPLWYLDTRRDLK